jgi:hypothetical protein
MKNNLAVAQNTVKLHISQHNAIQKTSPRWWTPA